jgi:hypothetical protein
LTHGDAPLRIAVDLLADERSVSGGGEGLLVLVDPLGGGADALLALEDEGAVDDDQLAALGGGSLHTLASAALRASGPDESTSGVWTDVLLADLLNARPACARIAGLATAEPPAAPIARVTFAARGADGVFVAGVLVRTLLDELDRASVLDDGAGIAIGVAGSTADMHAGLLLSERGRRLDRDNPAAVAAASQLDSVGLVGRFSRSGDVAVHLGVLPAPAPFQDPPQGATAG